METKREELRARAWIGDAVLALKVRTFLLNQFGPAPHNGENASAILSNLTLSTYAGQHHTGLRNATQFEAMIGDMWMAKQEAEIDKIVESLVRWSMRDVWTPLMDNKEVRSRYSARYSAKALLNPIPLT